MNEMKCASAFLRKVKQNLKVKLPILTLPVWGEYVEKMANNLSMDPYDYRGDEIEGMDRIMPCDLGFDTPLGESAIGATLKLMDIRMEVEALDKMPNECVKAMNTHYITGLSLIQKTLPPRPKVLVLCAGNGEDIPRLVRTGVTSFEALDVVGCTPFRLKNKLAGVNIDGPVRFRSEYVENLPKSWFKADYDLILCHHGLHHVMSTPAGSDRMRWLAQCLKPTGLIIADKVDLLGIDTLVQWSTSPTHGVELLQLNRTAGIEGRMSVRVGGKVWDDPVLSDKRVYDNFPGMNVHILQGRGAFDYGSNTYGDRFLPPPAVKLAAKRGEIRVMTYIEIRPRFLPVVIPSEPECTEIQWIRKVSLEGHTMERLKFPVNHGKHFQMEDIPFLSGNSLYAEKTHGLSARVVIGEGAAYAVVNTSPPEYYIAQGAMRAGLPILYLQCEWVDGNMVLLDPVHLGIDTPSGFYARMDYYDCLVRQSPWIGRCAIRKKWYTTIPMPLAADWEGVVVMSTSCPSPYVDPKYTHTARYAKWVTTVDVVGDPTPDNPRGIVEVCVRSGSFVRARPDKTSPNSAANIVDVARSIDLPGLLALLDLEYDSEVEARDLLAMRAFGKIVESHGVAICLRYPNRRNPNVQAQQMKDTLFATIGRSAPVLTRTAHVANIMEDFGWLDDVGMLGSGNSKGDGPVKSRFDLLVQAAEEYRVAAICARLAWCANQTIYGGKLENPNGNTAGHFNPSYCNTVSKEGLGVILRNSIVNCQLNGDAYGFIPGTRIPWFQCGASKRVFYFRERCDGSMKLWVGCTVYPHITRDHVKEILSD